MITDNNRDFLAKLPPKTNALIYSRVLGYAKRRLPRRAGIKDKDVAQEVTNEAYQRLLETSNTACWNEDPPTIKGLLEYLRLRVDDLIKNLFREEKRRKQRLSSGSPPSSTTPSRVESALYTEEIKEHWVELAYETSDKLGDFLVEWLDRGLGASAPELATTCGQPAAEIHRLKYRARNLLARLDIRGGHKS